MGGRETVLGKSVGECLCVDESGQGAGGWGLLLPVDSGGWRITNCLWKVGEVFLVITYTKSVGALCNGDFILQTAEHDGIRVAATVSQHFPLLTAPPDGQDTCPVLRVQPAGARCRSSVLAGGVVVISEHTAGMARHIHGCPFACL